MARVESVKVFIGNIKKNINHVKGLKFYHRNNGNH